MEALVKNTVTETDLSTLDRRWGQHLLSLVHSGRSTDQDTILYKFMFEHLCDSYHYNWMYAQCIYKYMYTDVFVFNVLGMEKVADRYERILYDSEETIINVCII